VIYICIPALNEAPTVGVLLWRIRQVMTEFRRDFHLIVLDDGSTDATAEVLGPYEKVLPLTLLRNERTAGYAGALERLLREAVARSTHPKRDIAVVVQADFTEPPEEIPALVKKLEGGADVVGSAVAGVDAELPRGLRWSRRGLPWLLGRARLPKEGGDPMSGFRAYRVQVIKRALADREGAPLLTRQGWAANAELLMAVAPHTRRTDQSAVQLRYLRRERETRFDPWPTLRETWELARRAPRRVLGALASEIAPSPVPAPAVPAPRGLAPFAEPADDAGEAAAPREGRRRNRPAPSASSPAEAEIGTSEETAAPREGRRRNRPSSSAPASAPAASASAPDETEAGAETAERTPRPRRGSRRRNRPASSGSPTGAEASEARAPEGEAPRGEGAEDTAAPREGRRRPPRRNRKRGRRDGNKDDQAE
jgi:hypothetical protein